MLVFSRFLRAVGSTDTYQRRSSRPIVEIDWFEAILYCEALTRRWHKELVLPDDWVVRLPTEIEWEKAARGGLQIPTAPVVAMIKDVPHMSLEAIGLKDNPHPKRRYPWGDQPSA